MTNPSSATFDKILAQFQSISPAAVSLDVSGIEEFNILSDIAAHIASPIDAKMYRWNLAEQLKITTFDKEGLSNVTPQAYENLWENDPIAKLYDEISNLVESDPIAGLAQFLITAAGLAKQPVIVVLQDIHHALTDDQPRNVRYFKTLIQRLLKSRIRLIFTGTNVQLSGDFDGMVAHHSEIHPSDDQILDLAFSVVQDLTEDSRFKLDLNLHSIEESLLRKTAGLSLSEISSVFRFSCRYHNREDALKADPKGLTSEKLLADIQEYKISKLAKIGVEFADAPDTQIGGLESLKTWVNRRRRLFNASLAGATNLPTPKGLFLVGVPGTGKSLAAKAIGQLYSVPVAKLDISSVFNSLVGESEKAIKNTLKKIDSIAPCVLWIDEIEKLFSNVTGANDSGVGSRVFGTFLTWMQEKSTGVFVVATANSIENLPPELLRKGRFDEIFFLDIPSASERAQILDFHLQRYNTRFDDLTGVLAHSDGFVGAEIAAGVDEAVLMAFDEGKPLEIGHLVSAFNETVPLSRFNAEKIQLLRKWGQSHARIANTIEQVKDGLKEPAKPQKTTNFML